MYLYIDIKRDSKDEREGERKGGGEVREKDIANRVITKQEANLGGVYMGVLVLFLQIFL